MSSRSRSPPPAAYHSPPPPPPRRGSGSRSPMDRSPRTSRSPTRRGASPQRRDSRSPPRSPRKDESSSVVTTLYISGLHPRTKESDLERKFSKYGKIVSIKLVTDPRTRESRGFGFVSLETPEQATACITNLNNNDVDGRKITVEKARRERSRSPTPGKYLGSDRLRRAINRPIPPPVYGGYPYRGGAYRPYPPPMPPHYGSYPYPPPPRGGYPDRYSPDRRRDRSPLRSPPRRYSPPPYRGRESPIRGGRDGRDRPFYSRDMHARDRSRSREREYR